MKSKFEQPCADEAEVRRIEAEFEQARAVRAEFSRLEAEAETLLQYLEQLGGRMHDLHEEREKCRRERLAVLSEAGQLSLRMNSLRSGPMSKFLDDDDDE